MASTHLSRTSGSPTNALKWTYSFWVKISSLSTIDDTFLLDFNTDGNNRSNIGFNASQQLVVYEKVSGSVSQLFTSNRLFRDPSAWMHIVVSCDRTLSTAGDRTKIYINGVQETSFAIQTNPAQNTTGIINTAVSTLIGKYSQNTYYFDGSLTHVHFVDGTAYPASTFGETDSTSGIWKPKTSPSVTYGSNGFFLKFENSSNMQTDSSGNANNFTVSGNLTQNVDTPSNVFATLNPLDRIQSNATYSNGNNTWTTTSGYYWSRSTLGVSSGKYYFEAKLSSSPTHGHIGIVDEAPDSSTDTGFEDDAYNWGYKTSDGKVYNNGNGGVSYGSTYTTGDIVAVALDLDNNKLYFSKNGTWQNSGDPTSGATGTGAISITDPSSTNTGNYFFAVGDNASQTNGTWQTNFGNGYFGTTAITSEGTNASGNGKFEYDVPTGYTALSTKGLNE